jgi:dUTP pyrophosphatase
MLESVTCRVIFLDVLAKLPVRASDLAAGCDLSSVEEVEVPARGRCLVRTGLAVEIPESFYLEVRPRSGLALHHGVTVLNTPGTIDADYRGEIKVLLYNSSDEPFRVHVGDRIAQILLLRHEVVSWEVVESLGETFRGTSGFGSTG